MKIAIVGAGIIGVTTAWELASDGHEVVVYERRGAAAEETSFANAGVVAPASVTPWAAPGMRAKVLRHLFGRHAPVRLRLPLSAADLRWMWRWQRACRLDTYLANRSAMQRLAFYSRERLHTLTADLQLEYDRSDGYLLLLRTAQDVELAQPGLQLLRETGLPFREVDAEGARRIEPALHPDTALAGAIHLPDDEVGNCRQFALLLKNEAQKLGARFEFGTTVAAIEPGPGPALRLSGAAAAEPFDAVVVCGGVDSRGLLRPLGLNLPLVPVYGYSVSAQVREPLNAPRSAVMDEKYKVAISRLGQRVRVAGSAEIGGRLDVRSPEVLRTLYKVLQDWFPGAARFGSGVQEWKGARPMLPDGPPVVGASGTPGIWLNLGHGSSGWALSCGSARVLADQIAGRSPEVDMGGMGVERLRRRR